MELCLVCVTEKENSTLIESESEKPTNMDVTFFLSLSLWLWLWLLSRLPFGKDRALHEITEYDHSSLKASKFHSWAISSSWR